jgi:hypothetical protein
MSEINGRYSVKEMLDRIVIPKLEAIDEKLVSKADRSSVHDLQSRMAALELVALRQGGPVVTKLEQLEASVRALEREGPLRSQLIGEFREAQEDIIRIDRELDEARGATKLKRWLIATSIAVVSLFLAMLALSYQVLVNAQHLHTTP